MGIKTISATEPDASIEKADQDSARKVSLPADKSVTLDIVLK